MEANIPKGGLLACKGIPDRKGKNQTNDQLRTSGTIHTGGKAIKRRAEPEEEVRGKVKRQKKQKSLLPVGGQEISSFSRTGELTKQKRGTKASSGQGLRKRIKKKRDVGKGGLKKEIQGLSSASTALAGQKKEEEKGVHSGDHIQSWTSRASR